VTQLEIGSEFWMPCDVTLSIYSKSWLPKGKDYTFTFSGRTAIETVLNDIGSAVKKALIPSYCCDSMIEPFQAAGIAVDFYDVRIADSFEINLAIPTDCDVLLWCNYFGFQSNYPKDIVLAFQKRGGIVIEDITHSLLSEKQCLENSNYLVASLRKWGPLLSGGFCSKRNGNFTTKPTLTPAHEFLEAKRNAMRLKAQYLSDGDRKKKTQYMQLFAESNHWLVEHYSRLTMDEESQYMLSRWNLDKIRVRRRKNAQAIYKELTGSKVITPLFPLSKMDCPLFVPVIVKSGVRETIRQRLIAEEIYCPIHWPHPQAECNSNLYDLEISLICDQRYSEQDMNRITSAINGQ